MVSGERSSSSSKASNRWSSRIAKIVALIQEEVESAEMTPLKVPLPRGDRRLQRICKAILREHGGNVEAASGPVGGAVFTVTLPAAAAASAGV